MGVESQQESETAWIHAGPAAWHHPVLGLLVLFLVADAVRVALGIAWADNWCWFPMTMWALTALSLLVGIARRLPNQNVVAVTLLGIAGSVMVDFLDSITGIPFGQREFGLGAGVCWGTGPVPILMAPLWITLLLMGRGVARLVLKRCRNLEYYGIWVLLLASILATLQMVLIESVATGLLWWRWSGVMGLTWHGTPWVAWVGGWVSNLMILAFLTPWLLNKRPVKQPVDWHPLIVWLLLGFWLAVHQARSGARVELALNGALNVLAVGATIWGTHERPARVG